MAQDGDDWNRERHPLTLKTEIQNSLTMLMLSPCFSCYTLLRLKTSI